MTPLQKLLKNVRDLGKFIFAKGFKKLPKVQKIAHSGHTACLLIAFSAKKEIYAKKLFGAIPESFLIFILKQLSFLGQWLC